MMAISLLVTTLLMAGQPGIRPARAGGPRACAILDAILGTAHHGATTAFRDLACARGAKDRAGRLRVRTLVKARGDRGAVARPLLNPRETCGRSYVDDRPGDARGAAKPGGERLVVFLNLTAQGDDRFSYEVSLQDVEGGRIVGVGCGAAGHGEVSFADDRWAVTR